MPDFSLQPPKPIGLNAPTLGNPWVKPTSNLNTGIVGKNYYQKPLPPNRGISVGNVRVETTKPIVVQGDASEPETEKKSVKKGFWAQRSKTEKGLIIGGALIAVVAIAMYIRKK